MNNIYLIPANSKKSMKIFGMFYTFDLILLCSGIALTLLLITILPIDDILYAVISLLPVGITGLLVFPIPNYHNVLTVLISMWNFFTTRQKYVWKGWCVYDGYKDEK